MSTLVLRILYFEDLPVGMAKTLSKDHRILGRRGICAPGGTGHAISRFGRRLFRFSRIRAAGSLSVCTRGALASTEPGQKFPSRYIFTEF
jgi:hypothetical protein